MPQDKAAKHSTGGLARQRDMLEKLNSAAIIFLSHKEDSYEHAMSEGIRLIAGATGVDCVSVFKNARQPDGLHLSQIYRWDKNAGTTRPLTGLADATYAGMFPRWERILAAGGVINGPAYQMPEAGLLESYGTASLLCAPIFYDGKFWGFVCFESLTEEKSFSPHEADTLRTASLMLANTAIRNEAAKSLREADEHIKLMMDATPLGCTLWNSDHRIIDCNAALVSLLELRNKDEWRDRFFECSPERQPDGQQTFFKLHKVLEKAFKSGRNVFEWTHRTVNGVDIPAEVTLVRVRHGAKYLVAGYIRDLREHNRMMRELEQTLHDVRAADRAKSEFLSRMSHEMRTPMNAIIGMTAIGKASGSIEKKDYSFEKIDEASRHLLGVINDVLDMSKIEANKLELSENDFEFGKMLQKVMNVLSFRVEERRQKLSVNIDETIPRSLFGDDQRLAQVITNILSNAVKFSHDEGAIHLDARLLSEKDGVCLLQISVTDHGIGLTEEQKSRVFNSFEQAEAGTSRTYGGTGLGLSISKCIVELMGGEIWVESEAGEGAKFSFTAVLRRGRGPAAEAAGAENTRDSGATGDFSGRVLLLAEDVEINREIVVSLLEPLKITVVCANDGAQALSMFKEAPEKYDLIFMDVQMPVMDGFEATRLIRALSDPKAKKVPIVAMTANVFREDIERCIAAGMDAHLGKPVIMEEVLAVLRKHLCVN